MIKFFSEINPIIAAFIMGLVTFTITSLGAATIFLFKKINQNIMDKLLSLSAGIMLSSSIFSLVVPAIDHAKTLELTPWIICSVGITLGALLLYITDKIEEKQKNKRIDKLLLSITIHNIPEGAAIGVAFGALALNNSPESVMKALTLAIGIGIQNFPEGLAISFPMLKKGKTKLKSFLIGSLSAIVEPIAAILGALLVIKMQFILPLLLSVAGGAMLYVIVVELIPESMANKKKELMALYTIIGFIIMMILDISLG